VASSTTNTFSVCAAEGNNQVTLNWLPPGGATQYEVFFKSGAGVSIADTKLAATSVSGYMAIATSLINATSYSFLVVAHLPSGQLEASAPVSKAPVATLYSVGQTGPAGGKIFYVNPYYATDGWRYMETVTVGTGVSALSVLQGGIPINPNGLSFPSTGGTAIGTGKGNTAVVYNLFSGTTSSNNAAAYCRNYNLNGYTDWFLPSKDEVEQMRVALNDFGSNGYGVWSSTFNGSVCFIIRDVSGAGAWTWNTYWAWASNAGYKIRPIRQF
jgi:hypothetical protein